MADFASIRFQPSRPLLRELSADRLNSILTEIKRNKPKGERGITVRQDGTGTYIGLAAALPRGGGGTSAPTAPQPWDLIARVDPEADPEDENPPYLVTVRPGTLNGILPSNWEIEEQVDGTGLYYAKAVIATDGAQISNVTIAIDGNPPAQPSPAQGQLPQTEYLFGLFFEGQTYRLIGPGSISLDSSLWMITTKDTAVAPGLSPYEFFYLLR